MKLFYLFSLSLISMGLFLPFSSNAQKYSDPAKIVTLSGDTVTGLFDYREWKMNPTVVKFKKEGDAKIEEFGPDELNAFLFYDEAFVCRTVTITKSPRKSYELSLETEYPSQTKTVFLRVLVAGKASLYQYIDANNKDHYYIETFEKPLLELIYFKYQKEEYFEMVVKENKKYIGQLTVYLDGCPEIREQINKTAYKDKDLRQLVVAYNKCKNETGFYVYKAPATNFKIGIFAGISVSGLNFASTASYKYIDDVDFELSIRPTMGLSFLFAPRHSKSNWTMYMDVHVKSQRYTHQFVERISDTYNIYRTLTLKSSSLNFTLMGRYSLKGKRFSPYIGAGLKLGINPFFSSGVDIRSDENGKVTKYDENIFSNYSVMDLGFAAAAGVTYKQKLFLDLRFDYGLTTPYPTSARNNSLYFVVGYFFN
jgi:hypothetical protein